MKEYNRYEKARMVGARALQLSRGAPSVIDTKLKDPKDIAELEFDQGVIPIEVKRRVKAK
ncbi:MAG: DNA-directed RNA polymerase subunit K [Candidatus Aenigmatarchaeota archaeon]